MNKERIKEKVIKEGKPLYLSAQEYAQLTSKEKILLNETLNDEKIDADDYERNMKKLWPREVTMKPLVWRKR